VRMSRVTSEMKRGAEHGFGSTGEKQHRQRPAIRARVMQMLAGDQGQHLGGPAGPTMLCCAERGVAMTPDGSDS